jgi:hypothetical protein
MPLAGVVDLRLHGHLHEQVLGKRVRHALPFCQEADSRLGLPLVSAAHEAAHGEGGDDGRHGDQPHRPGDHDAEAPAAAAADRPEEALAHGGAVQEPPLGVHHLGVHHVVRAEAVLAHHGPEPAAAEVAADADRGADPRGEPERPAALARHGVVELPERGARAGPRHAAPGVHADVAERGDVDHGEGPGARHGSVGEALVVVAAAAGPDREAVAPAAGDAGPRLGDGRRGQQQRRARRPRGREAEVLDRGVQKGRVRSGRRGVDEPGRVGGGRREARDAADEAPVEGAAAALLLRGTSLGEEQQEEEREVPGSWSHSRLRLAHHLLHLHGYTYSLALPRVCFCGLVSNLRR